MRLGIAGAALLVTACGVQAPTDRPSARSWVLLVAEGVRVADHACAEAARSTKRADVAAKCAHGYDAARAALIAAEASLDVAGAPTLGCALRDALAGLQEVARGIDALGAKLPPAVADALTLGSAVAGARCQGGAR